MCMWCIGSGVEGGGVHMVWKCVCVAWMCACDVVGGVNMWCGCVCMWCGGVYMWTNTCNYKPINLGGYREEGKG